jgi:hypothetical protein
MPGRRQFRSVDGAGGGDCLRARAEAARHPPDSTGSTDIRAGAFEKSVRGAA